MGYDYFDRIFCITLEGQYERQESMDLLFKNLNINVEYFIAKRHPRGGRVGCFDSHYQVCKIAKMRGYSNILVFEDDVIITPAYSLKKITNITNFMKKNKWECVQLGYGPQVISDSVIPISFMKLFTAKRLTPNIVNFHGAVTHAYCLSILGIDKVIQNAEKELAKDYVEHYDIWLYNIILDTEYCFASLPILFDQDWCFHTTNKYEKITEFVSRQFSCNLSKINMLYNWSLLVYYKRIVIYFIILITLYILFVMIILDIFYKY